MQKRRIKKIINSSVLGTFGLVGVSSSGIILTQCSKPDPIPHTYKLTTGDITELDWNPDKFTFVTLKMWEDDKDISKDVTFRAGSTNVTIAGNKLTYDKVIDNEKLKVTVTGTYNNNAASTEIELWKYQQTSVLSPEDPEWKNIFNKSTGTLTSDDIKNPDWTQQAQEHTYTTIDLSCFDIIADDAFANSTLLKDIQEKLTISFENINSTLSIGAYAFWSCGGIKNIVLPTNFEQISIGENAFSLCDHLENVSLPSADSPTNRIKNITETNSSLSIGDQAFFQCSKLKTFSLPNCYVTIDFDAFGICHDFEGFIPSEDTKIARIEPFSFDGCPNLEVDKIIALTDKFTEDSKLSIVSNGNYGAAIIRSSAGFITCVIGSAGNLGNAVNSYFEEEYWSYFIYDRLFASNPALQEIDLSQATGWGHIGTEAFENCANLKEIRFPNTEIDLIDEGAFKNCTGLEHIYWNHDVCPEVKSNAFDNVKKNGILHVSTSYRNSAGSAVETGQPVTDWGNLSDWKYAVES